MKANEFVKKFGWEISIDVSKTIQKSSWVDVRVGGWWSREFVELPELKRLVESHEIVESHKFPEDDETGLDGAHCLLDMYGGYELVGEKLERLKQAIADVEACQ